MRLRYFCVAAVAMLLSLGSSACASNEPAPKDLAFLDDKVPRLSLGTSVEEVEDQLGVPRNSAVLEDGEVTLHYGLWLLVFDPKLKVRSRFYRAGYWPKGRSFGSLDRGVHRLRLGSSKTAIERELGKPGTWEVLDFKTRERLWYGNGRWKLQLRGGRLASKERSAQVTGPSAPARQ
jgi:hypothetical protein